MKLYNALAVLAVAGVTASASAPIAQAVNITSSGTWNGAILEPGGSPTLSIDGNTVSWGVPFIPDNPAGVQSSYVFDSNGGVEVDDTDLLLNGAQFKIGTFTHNNFTITGNGGILAAASLEVDLSFDGANTSSFNFDFAHNETPNSPPFGFCPDGGVPPCPDVVSIPSLVSSESVNLAGADFNLEVVGFLLDDSDPSSMVDSFLTTEAQANSAWIIGQLSIVPGSPPPEVPLEL